MVGRRSGRAFGGSWSYDDDTGSNIVVTTAGTFYPIVFATGASENEFGCTVDATAGKITLPKGKYKVDFSCSGTGEASDLVEVVVHNGSTATEISARQDYPSTGMADENMAGSGVIDVTAIEADLTLKFTSNTNADSVTWTSASLSAVRIGPPG
ncbi:MAG: hypothetical protein VW405_01630 [Rhodospirillaceae bacterium]